MPDLSDVPERGAQSGTAATLAVQAATPDVVDTTGTAAAAAPRGAGARVRALVGRADVLLSLVVIAGFVVVALVPTLASGQDPLYADPSVSLAAPSAQHWFGTDRLGRDIFARVVHGAGVSLTAAAAAVAISFVSGVLLGVVAAVAGGAVDAVVMRVFDALLSIPGLLLVFAVLAVFGNGVMMIALAIGIGGSVSFGRLMRAEVLRVRASTYVEAATALGVRPFGVVVRHIVPNALTPTISLAALEFGTAMLTIGAMGYLGFGQEPPAPEWGALIADGQRYLRTAWWMSILPGTAFVVVVLAVNRISRVIGAGGTGRD